MSAAALRGLREEVEGHVGVVVLSRPEAGNAIDEGLAFEIGEVSRRLDQDDRVRVVVITGTEGHFCGGTDVRQEREAFREGSLGTRLGAAGAVADIGKPVIAAIEGEAVDQGLELALACDLRVASDGAAFAMTQVDRGLIPWDGGTQRLPRLVGVPRAIEMVLTCRRIDAREALQVGLVSEVVATGGALERSLEIAGLIAGHGPIAARYLKEAVMKGLDLTVEQGLRLEADLSVILQSTEDREEGLRSFAERRAPRYAGR